MLLALPFFWEKRKFKLHFACNKVKLFLPLLRHKDGSTTCLELAIVNLLNWNSGWWWMRPLHLLQLSTIPDCICTIMVFCILTLGSLQYILNRPQQIERSNVMPWRDTMFFEFLKLWVSPSQEAECPWGLMKGLTSRRRMNDHLSSNCCWCSDTGGNVTKRVWGWTLRSTLRYVNQWKWDFLCLSVAQRTR